MIFNNEYELKNLIGKRKFGIVYKVLDNKNNQFYALKFIKHKNTSELNKFLNIEWRKKRKRKRI